MEDLEKTLEELEERYMATEPIRQGFNPANVRHGSILSVHLTIKHMIA